MGGAQQTMSEFSSLMKSTHEEVPKRFIFFVVDDQDVLAGGDFHFSHIEVNGRLNSLISKKTWESKAA